MRTTVTLDDDVAAALERLRKSTDSGLKELINDALRRGLKEMSARPKRTQSFRTKSVGLGRVRLASIDNVGEALALAEAESFK
jgi:predicted flavoprotein YhiN